MLSCDPHLYQIIIKPMPLWLFSQSHTFFVGLAIRECVPNHPYLLVSHVVPYQPVAQLHVNWFRPSVHVAPFWQGSLAHSLVSRLGEERPWWRHQMETLSALRVISPVNSPHKGQWREALMLSLICVWINDLENNREADLRRYRAHYDVTVMHCWIVMTSFK